MGTFTVYIDEVPTFELRKGHVYLRNADEGGPDIAMPLDIYFATAQSSATFREVLAKRRAAATPISRGRHQRKG